MHELFSTPPPPHPTSFRGGHHPHDTPRHIFTLTTFHIFTPAPAVISGRELLTQCMALPACQYSILFKGVGKQSQEQPRRLKFKFSITLKDNSSFSLPYHRAGGAASLFLARWNLTSRRVSAQKNLPTPVGTSTLGSALGHFREIFKLRSAVIII